MSILFFDGFDRCTITKDLDPNYWSYQPGQPLEYEKYAFGGYSYNHTTTYYPNGNFDGSDEGGVGRGEGYYDTYSPNNGTLPTGEYLSNATSVGSGNGYPGFGAPPGFLALANLDISDSNMLTPITYVQLSGFNTPSGDSTFLTTRILGLETKDTNYAISDKPGRFDSRHPIVAFCSGNVTGLILYAVKVTGNHLETLEEQKMTMAIEVEQTEGVSGHFDMNITNDLNNFRVRSVFGGNFDSVNSPNLNEENNGSGLAGRILTTVADHEGYKFSNPARDSKLCPTSRWCHLQFGVVGTGTVPYVQIKLEDVDLLSIPSDDTVIDKDNWEDKIYISGFDYNNIRFFNRTYNGDLQFRERRTIYGYGGSSFIQNLKIDHLYYMKGSVTLLDDIILSDDAGTTSTFLGKNAKVVPFTPGASGGYIADNYQKSGLLEWNTNASSTILALKNLDGDTGKISTSVSGAISAVPYIPYGENIGTPDMQAARHLSTIQDAIGGIKIYAQAKKEFLDTRYIPVAYTGSADPLQTGVFLFLNFENNTQPLVSDTRPTLGATDRWAFFNNNGQITTEEFKIGNSSLKLHSGDYIESIKRPTSAHPIYDYPELSIYNVTNGRINFNTIGIKQHFSMECWVKFTGLNDNLMLWEKSLNNLSNVDQARVQNHNQSYSLSINTGCLTYFRHGDRPYSTSSEYYDNTGILKLNFPQQITDNNWHHFALTKTETGLIVFLDGVSGTSYELDLSMTNTFSVAQYDVGFGESQADSRTGTNDLFYWQNAKDSAKYFAGGFNGGYGDSFPSPVRISGNGYIDGYRIQLPEPRYTENFTPPLTEDMKSERDNYIELGDVQTLSKTRYGKIHQFYQYNDPNNQPWSTGFINAPLGFIMGVKKL